MPLIRTVLPLLTVGFPFAGGLRSKAGITSESHENLRARLQLANAADAARGADEMRRRMARKYRSPHFQDVELRALHALEYVDVMYPRGMSAEMNVLCRKRLLAILEEHYPIVADPQRLEALVQVVAVAKGLL